MNEIVLGILPALFLLGYILWVDRRQPEPFHELLLALLGGVGAILLSLMFSVPATLMGLVQMNPGNLFEAFCVSFFGAGIPEELAKLIVLWILVSRNKYFDERVDGIVYAACVSLGFAAVENILYIAQAGDDMLHVALVRGLLSVPGHFCFAVLMGYWFAKFWWEKENKMRNLFLTLAMPVMWHTLYDWICFATGLYEGRGDNEVVAILTSALILFSIIFHSFARRRTLLHLELDMQSNVMEVGDTEMVPKQDDLSGPLELYSNKQILLFSFLMSPLAGIVMLSRNCNAMDKPRLKNIVWAVGIVAYIVPASLALYVDGVPNVASLVSLFAVYFLSQKLQDEALRCAEIRGGLKPKGTGSAFGAALVGLAYGVISLLIVCIPLIVKFQKNEVTMTKYNQKTEFAKAHDYNKAKAKEGDLFAICYLACECWDKQTHADSLEAEVWLGKCIEEGDSAATANTLNDVAYLYSQNNNNVEALALLDRAIEIFPEEANLYDSRGEILWYLGRKEEALEMYNEVLARDSRFFKRRESVLEKLLVEAEMI